MASCIYTTEHQHFVRQEPELMIKTCVNIKSNPSAMRALQLHVLRLTNMYCGCRGQDLVQHVGGAAYISEPDEGQAGAALLPPAPGLAGGCGHHPGQRQVLQW